MSVFWSGLKGRESPLSSITPIWYSFSNFAESSINKILSFSNCSTLLFKSVITFDFRSICLFSSWDSNDCLFSSSESCFLFLGLCSNALNLPLSPILVRLVDNTWKRFWSFEHLRELRGNFNFKLLLHNQFLVIFFNSVHYEWFEIQRNEWIDYRCWLVNLTQISKPRPVWNLFIWLEFRQVFIDWNLTSCESEDVTDS